MKYFVGKNLILHTAVLKTSFFLLLFILLRGTVSLCFKTLVCVFFFLDEFDWTRLILYFNIKIQQKKPIKVFIEIKGFAERCSYCQR